MLLLLQSLFLLFFVFLFPVIFFRLKLLHREPRVLGSMMAGVHFFLFFTAFFLRLSMGESFFIDSIFSGLFILDFPSIVIYYMSFSLTFIFLKIDPSTLTFIREIIAFGVLGTIQFFIMGKLLAVRIKNYF